MLEHKSKLLAYYKLRWKLFIWKMGWDIPAVGDLDFAGDDALAPIYQLIVKMGWEIQAISSSEIDLYDMLRGIIHLLCLTEDGEHLIGGIRLVPTMGLNMLNDEPAFRVLLPDGQPIRSPKTFESSRFAIDWDLDFKVGEKKVSFGVAEIGLASIILSQRLGIDKIVTVYDAFLHKRLQRWGLEGTVISGPLPIGKVNAYAACYDGPKTEKIIRAVSGLSTVDFRDDGASLPSFRAA
jgi:acyl homoserine lactone synthase